MLPRMDWTLPERWKGNGLLPALKWNKGRRAYRQQDWSCGTSSKVSAQLHSPHHGQIDAAVGRYTVEVIG